MLNHYDFLVKTTDRSVKNILTNQCLDESSPYYGICENHGLGYLTAETGATVSANLIAAYYTPESEYYQNEELLHRASLALRSAISLQHEDGTIDLPQTNFHCASTMAFTLLYLCPSFRMLREYTRHTAPEDEVEALLEQYVNGGADGMINCGFHTPNHRWVLSASLSMCYNLLGREDCLEHIRRFLNEGIDCDEEGEYTERSAGVYNIICNHALMTMACELNMPELLEHVKRNLRMVMKYIEPDHSINTLNSRRQDVGTSPDWLQYYSNYLYMAILTGDQEFAWFADEMLREHEARFRLALPASSPYMHIRRFLLDPAFRVRMAEIQPVRPVLDYEKYFEKSGLVRRRTGDLSVTLIKDRPVFAKFQWGKHTVHLRLAGCFFARGQFAPQELIPIEDGYRLTFHDRWGYKRPLAEKPASPFWHEMDHTLREKTTMRDFDLCVDVRFVGERRVEMNVAAGGGDRVPVKLEVMFQPGGRYTRDEIELRMHGGDYLFQKKGESAYVFDDNRSVRIEGGFYEHYYAENMRGALPADEKSAFVAMTAYAPFEQKIAFDFE